VGDNINLPPIPEFADVTLNTEPITAEELRNALKGFKSGKACGRLATLLRFYSSRWFKRSY
jgi:hypothetical protein